MKKIISILCALTVMAGFCACGNDTAKVEDSQSSIEEITEKPTEKTTEKPTESPTKKITEAPTEKPTEAPTESKTEVDQRLDDTHTIGEISINLPKNCSVDKEEKDGVTSYTIVLPDDSMIMASYLGNASDVSLASISDDEKAIVLESYASAFVSSDSWKAKTELEDTEIKGIAALKQEAVTADIIECTLYHFIYNEVVYSLGFAKIPTLSASSAYDLQDEIIDTLKFNSAVENTDKQISVVSTEKPTPEITQEAITLGMENALSAAKDYLNVMSFSYSGLIEQLEYEKYSHEEAVYGADNCGADWNEQAAKSAQGYIDTMSFSRQELIDQLVYEGFTQEQAEYGVQAVGY